MKLTLWNLALVIVLCCTTGCGTVHTLGNNATWPNQVYAGMRAAAGGFLTQLDVPFSLVADTLVLPYTIPRTVYNQKPPPRGTPTPPRAERASTGL